jgi:deazaflavin-dependent oxidoreductase (nitroreductase family)
MNNDSRIPIGFWQLIELLNRCLLLRYKQTRMLASRILVLTTTGRKSGIQRQTPLQYEEFKGSYYVASARGVQADWYQNLVVHPNVIVQVGDKCFHSKAKLMTNPKMIADFLELRAARHPHFMGVMLRLEGLPHKYTRVDLEKLADRLAIVVFDPENA